ncbi:MAG: response regulator, partial [Campylobacterota bacterium]|nr:response regulator [Campylobacterota bacterium]
MFQNLTALYVEDEEQLRTLVSSILDSLFDKCFLGSNGEEGLELYKQNEDDIDIIITDISMPIMDGLMMSKEIRNINRKIPIIITTAHNDKDFLHKAIEIGVTKFVTKPLDMKLLIESIRQSVEPILLQIKLDEELKISQEQRIQNAKFAATAQLAAGITHEINTPITYIKANFEMMQYDIEDLPDSNIKNSMESSISKINDGIHRVETIISSMKELSQQLKAVK